MDKKPFSKNLVRNLVVGALFLFSFSFVFALEIPTYNQFYGFINYSNGSLVADSVSVAAYFNGSLVLSSVSVNGRYGYDPVFIIENLTDNDTISFYVNNSFSKNISFTNEDTTNLNLVINSSAPIIIPPIDNNNDNNDNNDNNVNTHGSTSSSRIQTTKTTTIRTTNLTAPTFSFEQSVRIPLAAFLSDQYENNRTGLIILIILFSIAILLIAIVLILFVVRKIRSREGYNINPVAEKEKRAAEWKQLEREAGTEEQNKMLSRMPIVKDETKALEIKKPFSLTPGEIKPVVIRSFGSERAEPAKSADVLKAHIAAPVVRPINVKPAEVVSNVKPGVEKTIEVSKSSEKSTSFIEKLESFISPKPISAGGHGLAKPVVPIRPVVEGAKSSKPAVNPLEGKGLFIEDDNRLRFEISKRLVEGRAALKADDFDRIRSTYNIIKGLYNSLNYRDYKTYYLILDFYNEIIKQEY